MSSTVILIVLLAACVLMHLVGHGHGGHGGHGPHTGGRDPGREDHEEEREREQAGRSAHRHH